MIYFFIWFTGFAITVVWFSWELRREPSDAFAALLSLLGAMLWFVVLPAWLLWRTAMAMQTLVRKFR